MAHTFHKIWIHLIWCTKDRRPLLPKDIRADVFAHLKEKAREEGIVLDALNGTADHVHALARLDPAQSLPQVVRYLKGESSHWVNEQKLTAERFAWQEGYTALSYGESQIPKVREYIKNQEEHHRRMSFKEELEGFLKQFNIEGQSDVEKKEEEKKEKPGS
jgi:REP element-mobilizing transposase RayT